MVQTQSIVVGGCLECRIEQLEASVRGLLDDLQRSETERIRQHQKLMDMVRGRWGSTSQTVREGPSSHDRDSSPKDRNKRRSHVEGTDPESVG
ncbi:hypothetical protein Ddye_008825 [Dipteronia dyeriana]|uniref:Uncharacterized protein n=1 Tax=Dipteronia dyeriana TaxID=168575 RepID=A0AAD9XAH7_9ROSI|nr:hypothetical protein Ddye_008825 [Dipteronia dyeriana]